MSFWRIFSLFYRSLYHSLYRQTCGSCVIKLQLSYTTSWMPHVPHQGLDLVDCVLSFVLTRSKPTSFSCVHMEVFIYVSPLDSTEDLVAKIVISANEIQTNQKSMSVCTKNSFLGVRCEMPTSPTLWTSTLVYFWCQ